MVTGHLSASHLPYLSRTSSARDHQNQPPSPVFATLSHGRLLLLLLLLMLLHMMMHLANIQACTTGKQRVPRMRHDHARVVGFPL